MFFWLCMMLNRQNSQLFSPRSCFTHFVVKNSVLLLFFSRYLMFDAKLYISHTKITIRTNRTQSTQHCMNINTINRKFIRVCFACSLLNRDWTCSSATFQQTLFDFYTQKKWQKDTEIFRSNCKTEKTCKKLSFSLQLAGG